MSYADCCGPRALPPIRGAGVRSLAAFLVHSCSYLLRVQGKHILPQYPQESLRSSWGLAASMIEDEFLRIDQRPHHILKGAATSVRALLIRHVFRDRDSLGVL